MLRALLLALVGAGLLLVLVSGTASAAAGHPMTCADVTAQATPSTLGSRYWFVTDAADSSPGTASGCSGAAPPLRERAPGDSITLVCRTTTTGISPPAAATTVTIYAQSDNANSGSPATSPIWSSSFAGGCGANPTATFYCTSNGLVGGSPRLGLVRFIVEAVKTGAGSYDVLSDTGSAGAGFTEGSAVMRCQANATAFTDAQAGFSQPSVYVGGDVLRSVLTAQVDYSPASLGSLKLVCAGSSNTAGAVSFTTSTVTIDTTIQGTTSAWPDDCALAQNVTITRTSAIPSFTPPGSVLYVSWNATPCGTCGTVLNVGGVTAALNRSLTPPLDRTLTTGAFFAGSCDQRNVNRGDTVAFGCVWKNARTFETNGRDFRGYATSAGFRDQAAFAHADGSIGGGGSGGWANWTSTATTSALASTSYHQQVDDFAAGHVGDDNFLFNWGNTTPLVFTVSSTGTFDGINVSKTSGGVNATSFTIGADLEFATVKGLRNATGSFVSGVSVSCQRTRPDQSAEPAVVMGNTDASGNSPEQQFQVVAPAGIWRMTCSAAWSGNNASYQVSFFHVSPFTGNLQAPLLWNATLLPNGTMLLNMTTCLREYDAASDSVVAVSPDDVVRLTIFAYNATDDIHDIRLVNRSLMQHEDGASTTATCFRGLLYADPLVLQQGVFGYVTMNFTGNPFMGAQAYLYAPNGNWSGNFTGNFTMLDATGIITISSAIDPYLPVLLWGFLMAYWLYFAAWMPATTAMMALGAAILPSQPWTFAASVVLNVLGIAIHALVAKGIIPTPWGKSRKES